MVQDELIGLWQSPKLPALQKLFQELQPSVPVCVRGLKGSALALAASSVLTQLKQNQVFILPDRESSAFFYHDIEKILADNGLPLEQKRVHYFPSSYRRPYDIEQVDNANVKLRSEIINKLVYNESPNVIVTYPEALAEKLVSTRSLRDNSFTAKKGAEVGIDDFVNFLYEHEYKQEDFVFEPGQFSWRGAIFDVFSYSEEYPYRIEFAGDQIESVRFFDANTQLSVREVDKFHIMPLASSLESSEQRVSFFSFLQPDDVFWIRNTKDVKNIIQLNYEKVVEEFEKLNSPLSHILPEDLSIDGDYFIQHIENKKVIEIDSLFLREYEKTIDFGVVPQNAFSKNVNLLLDEWIDNLQHGYRTVFLTENEQQRTRMAHIMADLLAEYNREQASDYQPEDLYLACPFILHEGFRDEEGKLCVYTDHQIFEKYHRFVVRDRYKRSEAFTLKEICDMQPGDYVVHITYGIGIYRGLIKMHDEGVEHELIKLEYKGGDIVYVSIHSLNKISKYVGKDGTEPVVNKLGSGAWERMKARTKQRVKELAFDLIKLYAQRKAQKGFAFSVDSYLQTELEASFLYEDTPDQVKACNDIKNDMESECPMDRLLCGDVGFGKTEVAIRAAFKAVCDSKQVAVLVPTTVLAFQHFNTFSERLKDMPCKVGYINRFRSTKEIKQTLKEVKEGKIDILIGTHRILAKDVEFKDLGLLVIDEEQKFGVGAKEKLRTLKATVDTLTMSATPIPRTLQFSMMGARDISVIATPPANRYPIQTEVHTFNEEILRDAISYELQRGGQVFVVHNKVQNIMEVAGMVKRLVPDARVTVGHGQMQGDQLEKVMMDFIDGRYDVLVATTIVESGLDITNANTMIINDAQNFALNVLHQLRGRVGRNNKKAFCYMLTKPTDMLNENAKKRLKAISDFSEIGSGFQIALRDMDIRGAGDVLGAEQSGFISDLGFEAYQKILNEAILELQDDEYVADGSDVNIVNRDCVLESDLSLLFPSEYVSSLSERLSLYKELEHVANDSDLDAYRDKLIDRFGPIPRPTQELLLTNPLRRIAGTLFFEKIVLKNQKLTCHFVENEAAAFYKSATFDNMLAFMQRNYPAVQMREQNHKYTLQIQGVKSVADALQWMSRMGNECISNQ